MDPSHKYLNILGAFHFVVAAIIALVACFPILHLTVGIAMLADPAFAPPEADLPATFGVMFRLMPYFFIAIAGSIILGGWLLALAVAFAGLSLLQRRRHTYCLVMGGVECAFTPIGTVLGVFTLLVLTRPETRPLFDGRGGAEGRAAPPA
jgi:hypothetical protein